MPSSVSQDCFGTLQSGQTISRYTISNSNGMSVQILDYGGIIQSINVPDKDGHIGDVALGFDSLKEYESDDLYFGRIVGRVANRIAGGQFTLDGQAYNLFVNNGPNSNHGGKEGFWGKAWKSHIEDNKVVLSYVSPDGEEGYPGELTLTVTYSLTDDNALTVDYHAVCNKATPVNFTQHSYFNLAGQSAGSIDDHAVTIYAERRLVVDDTNIPTGELRAVTGTEFDMQKPVMLGDRLDKIRDGCGFDDCYSLNNDSGNLVLAARVEHPSSGRFLECRTTEPGIQLYSAYYVKDVKGKGGSSYDKFCGFCLEAQHYPDSIHQPSFPNVVLRPGEIYKQKTVYTFGLL